MPVSRGRRQRVFELPGPLGEVKVDQDVLSLIGRARGKVSGAVGRAGRAIGGAVGGAADYMMQDRLGRPEYPDLSGLPSLGDVLTLPNIKRGVRSVFDRLSTPGSVMPEDVPPGIPMGTTTPEGFVFSRGGPPAAGKGQLTSGGGATPPKGSQAAGQGAGGGGGAAGGDPFSDFRKVGRKIFDRITKQQQEGVSAGEVEIGEPPSNFAQVKGPGRAETIGRSLTGIGQVLASMGPYGGQISGAIGQASKALNQYVEGQREEQKQRSLAQGAYESAGGKGQLPYGTTLDEALKVVDQEIQRAEAESGLKTDAATRGKITADTIAAQLGIEANTPSPQLDGLTPTQWVDFEMQRRQLEAAKERAEIVSGPAKKALDFQMKRLQFMKTLQELIGKGKGTMKDYIEYQMTKNDPDMAAATRNKLSKEMLEFLDTQAEEMLGIPGVATGLAGPGGGGGTVTPESQGVVDALLGGR